MIARHQTRGFSLIELLVVVVIIATVVSIAILSVGLLADDRRLETEARRFASLVGVAQDEAMMQGREFGLELMQSSYRFVEYDPFTQQWQLIADDLLRRRELPEEVEFDLYLEGKRVFLEADAARLEYPDDDSSVNAETESYVPHLLIYSSGDVTPFELAITHRPSNLSILLEGNSLGAIEVDAGES